MSDQPRLDPRFDARFQRGFAGEDRAAALEAWDPHPAQSVPAVAPAAAVEEIEEIEEIVELDEPAARNPYLLVLTIVSAAMIAAALGLLVYVASSQTGFYTSSPSPVTTLVLQHLAYQAPTALFTIGVLGLGIRLAVVVLERTRP